MATDGCGSWTFVLVSLACLCSLLDATSLGRELFRSFALEPETAGAAAKETGKWAESSDENVAAPGKIELAACGYVEVGGPTVDVAGAWGGSEGC